MLPAWGLSQFSFDERESQLLSSKNHLQVTVVCHKPVIGLSPWPMTVDGRSEPFKLARFAARIDEIRICCGQPGKTAKIARNSAAGFSAGAER